MAENTSGCIVGTGAGTVSSIKPERRLQRDKPEVLVVPATERHVTEDRCFRTFSVLDNNNRDGLKCRRGFLISTPALSHYNLFRQCDYI